MRLALRSHPKPAALASHETAVVGEIGPVTDWNRALQDVDAVLHLAARAHRIDEPSENEALYYSVNAEGTGHLAQAAVRSGVERFVYLSSVKVNGEASGYRPFASSDRPQPADAYGRSKWIGERLLMEAAAGSRMVAQIVRSPLVYGPGVHANFLRLLHWVDSQRPLPLKSIHNARSLVSLWNLCDLLMTLVSRPAASGIWMVSDGEDLSTPELINRLAKAMHRKAWLFPCPPWLLRWVGALTGNRAQIARLCGSLVVDMTATRETVGWSPPLTVDLGLKRTVEWYLSREGNGDHV